ncbi:hypothetical protein A0U94_05035 [Gluconobacter albidus]|nr:hypothetical protein A0U94_05035 [Gluconobacter albidus]
MDQWRKLAQHSFCIRRFEFKKSAHACDVSSSVQDGSMADGYGQQNIVGTERRNGSVRVGAKSMLA